MRDVPKGAVFDVNLQNLQNSDCLLGMIYIFAIFYNQSTH